MRIFSLKSIIELFILFAFLLVFQLKPPENSKKLPLRDKTNKVTAIEYSDTQTNNANIFKSRIRELIEEWRLHNTGPNKYVYTKEERDFARLCILEIGCSDDLISLIDELNKQDPGVSKRIFDRVIRELLESDGAASKLRQDIVSIRKNAKIRERWSYLAGSGCSPGELENFIGHTTSRADACAARIGNSIYKAKTDPLAALKIASNEVAPVNDNELKQEVYSDIVRTSKDLSLYSSVVSELGRIAEVSNGHSGNLINEARNLLFQQWTDADIKGVIDFLNQNPKNITPNDVSGVFSRVAVFKGSKAAFSLAQELFHPEQFDPAAMAVIDYTYGQFPKESMELALQIKSSKIREEAVKLITEGDVD